MKIQSGCATARFAGTRKSLSRSGFASRLSVTRWSLLAYIQGSWAANREALGIGPSDGFYWSTDRIWAESSYKPMTFDTKEFAEEYLRVHRKKLELSDVQP